MAKIIDTLIVDSQGQYPIREQIKEFLEEHYNFRADIAENAEQALSKIELKQYDLIILHTRDTTLPQSLEPYGLAKKIRKTNPKALLIGFCGTYSAGQESRAFFDDLLYKVFTLGKDLIGCLREHGLEVVKMPYKAVLFDLDGTLVHTRAEYRYMLVGEKVLKELGVTEYSKADIDRFWFEGDRRSIIRECFGLDPDLFWETYRKNEKLDVRKQHIEVYDDVDFLRELKQNDYKLGVVTGAPSRIANIGIEMLEERLTDGKVFDEVVIASIREGLTPKPSPDGLDECLRRLEVDKHKALFVGNSEEDSQASEAAGIRYVHLSRGEYDFPDLKTDIHSLYELREILGLNIKTP